MATRTAGNNWTLNHRLGGFHHPPGMTVGHQGGQHGVVQLVAAPHRAVEAEQRQSCQREIAYDVEHLVANAFIGVAQALGVEDAGLVDYDGIVQ